jgi:predicted enzyme related to lactoylglutathione lyase
VVPILSDAALKYAGITSAAAAALSATVSQTHKGVGMQVHYLEIVALDVDAVCAAYEAALGIAFGSADPLLGGARTAPLPAGGSVGVRGPLRDTEEPIVRPYWLVDDIEAALDAATKRGAVVVHSPLEIPGKGTFAIYIQGGGDHGFWQL